MNSRLLQTSSRRMRAAHAVAAVVLVGLYLTTETVQALAVQQVTSAGITAFDSSLAANGSIRAFVSDQSGNLDVYIQAQNEQQARPISTHPADDFSPALNHDGKRLAFVSRREDSLGDIYVMELGWSFWGVILGRERAMHRLTREKHEDRDPSFGADRNLVYFATRHIESTKFVLARYNISKKKLEVFDRVVGEQPAVASDGRFVALVRSGQIFIYNVDNGSETQIRLPKSSLCSHPAFSVDNRFLFATCRFRDTNQDGIVSVEDGGLIVRLSLDPATAEQLDHLAESLTPYSHDSNYPAPGPGRLEFSLIRFGAQRIFSISLSGQEAAASEKPEHQGIDFELKSEIQSVRHATFLASKKSKSELHPAILDELDLIALNGTSIDLDHTTERFELVEGLDRQVLDEIRFAKLIRIADQLLFPQRTAEKFDDSTVETLAEALETNKGIAIPSAWQTIAAARIGLSRGRLQDSRALLQRVLDRFPKRENLRAYVDFILAASHELQIGAESALRRMPRLLKKYPHSSWLRNNFVTYLCRTLHTIDSPTAILDSINRDLNSEPELRFRFILITADCARKIQDTAREESRLRDALAIDARSVDFADREMALWRLTELLLTNGRSDEAELEVRNFEKSMPSEVASTNKVASDKIAAFWRQRAARLILVNEPGVAAKRYEDTISRNDQDIEAHRGYIDAMARRGESERVVERYRRRLNEDPSAILRYYHGLAISYVADRSKDATQRSQILRLAADEVEAARDLDPSNPYFHQTLGWIYQQMSINAGAQERELQRASALQKVFATVGQIFSPREDGLLKLALREYELADQLADPESSQKIVLAQNLAEVYVQLGNPRKGLLYALKRISDASTLPFTSDEQAAAFYLLAARAASDAEQLELSIGLNQKALALFETTGNRRQVTIALELLALSFRELARFDEALQLYDRLEQIYDDQDFEVFRNNQLNRAYCLTKLGRDDDASPILDSIEVSLKADPNLMRPPQRSDSVKITIDKKSASYGRFDNFMRLMLVETLRIEIAERRNQADKLMKLWHSKYGLLEFKRSAAISADYPDNYLSYELALASSTLGYLSAKSSRYNDAVKFFELSLHWMDIFLQGEGGSDENELKIARNLTIAASAAISTGESDSEQQRERLTRLRQILERFQDRATQQSLPVPSLVNQVGDLLADLNAKLPSNNATIPSPSVGSDTELEASDQKPDEKAVEELQKLREDRRLIMTDVTRAWQYLAQRGHVNLASDALYSALESGVIFQTPEVRQRAKELAARSLKQKGDDPRVVFSEMARFGDLWASEILRRTGSKEAEVIAKQIIDIEPWSVEALAPILGEKSAFVLFMTDNGITSAICTDGHLAVKLSQIGEEAKFLCGENFKSVTNWYISEVFGSLKAAEAMADRLRQTSSDVRILPYPSAVFMVAAAKPSASEHAVIVSYQKRGDNETSQVIEFRNLRHDEKPTERGLALGIDAQLRCQPAQSKTARFVFKSDEHELPAIEGLAKWAPGARHIIFNADKCVDVSQSFNETWIALSSAALNQGAHSVYILKDDQNGMDNKGDRLRDFIEILALRQPTISKHPQLRAFAIGGFAETIKEHRRTAEKNIDAASDQMFDAFDDRDYLTAASLASRVIGYAATLDDSSVWSDAIDVAIRSRFAISDFDGALYLQKTRMKRIGEDVGVESRIEMNIAALAIAIKAASEKDAVFFRDKIESIGLQRLSPAQRREISRYNALISQMQQDYANTIKSYLEARQQATDQKLLHEAAERNLDIGNVYREYMSDFRTAMEYYQRALDAVSGLKESQELHARILIDLANTLISTGRVLDAIDLLNGWSEKLKATLTKVSRLRLNQVKAIAYYQAGQFQRSKEINDGMLAEIRPSRDFDVEAIRLDAQSLKAMIEGRFGDVNQAIRTLEDGIEWAIEMRLFSRASTRYNNLGYWTREMGQFDVAIGYFEKALEIDRRHGIKSGEAFDLRNLAYTLLRMGQLDRSKTLFDQSMRISKESGLVINSFHVWMGLGEVLLKSGKFSEAEVHFSEALKISQSGGLNDLGWRALSALADSALLQSKFEVARSRLYEAIQLIESLRAGIGTVAGRSGFLAEVSIQNVYEKCIDVLMRLQQPTEAWEISERARARAFIDSIGTQRSSLMGPEESQLLSDEIRLRSELTKANEEDSEKTKREYQDLIVRIRSKYPKLLQLSNIQAISLTELKTLLPADVVLIEYMVTEKRTHIWAISQSHQSAHSVDYGRSEIEQDIAKFQTSMKLITNPETLLKKMGSKLIGNLDPILAGVKRIVVVPHGPLHHLPFSALPTESGKTLVELVPIHYLESATLAKFVYDNHRPAKPIHLVAFGNPDRGIAMDLPFAKREVEAIGRSISGSRVFIGSNAKESVLKKASIGANYLHIASHGEFNSLQPMESRLMLSSDHIDDGDLRAHEIFSLNLKNATVVLSACETGLGQVSQGDEIVGMNRAFLYSGANSLVSSLWRVSDVASAVLMKRFYRAVAAGVQKDIALRQAQLAVKERYPHPAYWAPMRLIGNYH